MYSILNTCNCWFDEGEVHHSTLGLVLGFKGTVIEHGILDIIEHPIREIHISYLGCIPSTNVIIK